MKLNNIHWIEKEVTYMPLTIIRNDITTMNVDVIVNAANAQLQKGGGVCGAIFSAAGSNELQRVCDTLAPIQTGEAVITPGFKLEARYIIHAVGPVYQDGKQNEEEKLRAAYRNSLYLALEHKCSSIAFPLISSGIYGYPKEEALNVALNEMRRFLDEHEMDVYLVLFDKSTFVISQNRIGAIQSYIDDHYEEEHTSYRSRSNEFREYSKVDTSRGGSLKSNDLNDWIQKVDQSFSETLLALIDEKGLNDVNVYKRANMNRKHFSKIRSNKHYIPSKRTVLALSIAMCLDREETDDLLECAGYALSSSQLFDVIISYSIENRIYDIDEINLILFQYDLALLGV